MKTPLVLSPNWPDFDDTTHGGDLTPYLVGDGVQRLRIRWADQAAAHPFGRPGPPMGYPARA